MPITVVLELEWVLRGAYQLPRDAVHLEQDELVLCALEWHRQGLDFADALHLASSEGYSALISFDRSLQRSAAELRLSPRLWEP